MFRDRKFQLRRKEKKKRSRSAVYLVLPGNDDVLHTDKYAKWVELMLCYII